MTRCGVGGVYRQSMTKLGNVVSPGVGGAGAERFPINAALTLQWSGLAKISLPLPPHMFNSLNDRSTR